MGLSEPRALCFENAQEGVISSLQPLHDSVETPPRLVG